MADLVIPKLGESISEAVIAKWLKKVGETIAVDEPVVDLETDKVSVALPAPAAGVLAEQRFAAGDTVKVGEVIGVIAPAAAGATAPAPSAKTSDGNGQKTPARAEAAALGGTGALGQPAKESGGPRVIGGVVEQMEPAPRAATVPSTQTAGQQAAEHAPEVPHSKTLPPSVRKALREGAHYEPRRWRCRRARQRRRAGRSRRPRWATAKRRWR